MLNLKPRINIMLRSSATYCSKTKQNRNTELRAHRNDAAQINGRKMCITMSLIDNCSCIMAGLSTNTNSDSGCPEKVTFYSVS